MEPRLRASPEQFSILIEFMERHGDLSRPQSGPQGRIKSDRLWKELSNTLNSIGGGVQKTPDKWKKVWADWKTKTKKKYLSLRRQASGTGGGPSCRIALTAVEERVVAVIGVSAVVGQAGIRELGFNRTSHEPPLLEPRSGNEFSSAQSDALDIVLEDQTLNSAVATPASPIIQWVSTPPNQQHMTPPAIHTAPELSQSPLLPPPPPPAPPLPPRSSSPPLPSPRPRTPPARNNDSPRSTNTTPRRTLLRARRNRGLTPFERAADQFAAVERRRLQHEETQGQRYYDLFLRLEERDRERLRLESDRERERMEVTRQISLLLRDLTLLHQRFLDELTRQRTGSLPSTDPI